MNETAVEQARCLMDVYRQNIDKDPLYADYWQRLYDSAGRDLAKALDPRAWQDAKSELSGMQFRSEIADKHTVDVARYLRGIDRLIAVHAPIKRLKSSGHDAGPITGLEPVLSTESRRARWEGMVEDAYDSARERYDPYIHGDMHRIASAIRLVYVQIWREVNPDIFIVDERSVDPDNPATYEPKWYESAIGARAGSGRSQLEEQWYQDAVDAQSFFEDWR